MALKFFLYSESWVYCINFCTNLKSGKTFHFAYQVCNIYQIPTMYDHSNFEERALVGQFVEIWLAYYRVPI